MLQARYRILIALCVAVLPSLSWAYSITEQAWGTCVFTLERVSVQEARLTYVSADAKLRASGQPFDLRLKSEVGIVNGVDPNTFGWSGTGGTQGQVRVILGLTGETKYVWVRIYNNNDSLNGSKILGPFVLPAGQGDPVPPVESTYQANFAIPGNGTDHPVIYNIYAAGSSTPVRSFTQPAGAGPVSLTVGDLPSNAPLTVKEVTTGTSGPGSGGVWESGGGTYEREVGTATPQPYGSTPNPKGVIPPTETTATGQPPAPTIMNTPTVNRNVYTGTPNVQAPTGSSSDMSIAAYREGVDKVTDATKQSGAAIVGAVQSASASQSTRDGVRDGKIDAVGTKVEGLGGKLDSGNTHLAQIQQNTLATAESMSDALAELRKLSARDEAVGADGPGRASSGEAAASAQLVLQKQAVETSFSSQWNTQLGADPSPGSTVTGSLGGGEWPSVDFPILGTITFSPDEIPWLGAVMTGCREIILILLCVSFVRLQFERANKYELAVMTVNPPVTTQTVVENALPAAGQILAWAKTAITALLVVQIAVGAYAAAVFVMDTQLMEILGGTWRAMVSGTGWVASSLGSASNNAWWSFALTFFPLDAFLKLLVADVVCLFSMGKLFLLASAVVKAVRA